MIWRAIGLCCAIVILAAPADSDVLGVLIAVFAGYGLIALVPWAWRIRA